MGIINIHRILDEVRLLGCSDLHFTNAIAPVVRLNGTLRTMRSQYPEMDEEENELMKIPSSIQIYEPVGCPSCNNTGYKGRTAIHEIIHCTAKVSAIIAAGGGKEEIEAAAKANGTKLLRDNAAELVQAGQTSIDELVRSTFSV